MLDIAFPPSFSEARGLERGRFADPFRIDCGLLCCPPAPGGAASVPATFVTVLSHWNCVPPRGDSGGCAGAGKHVTNRADLAGPHSAPASSLCQICPTTNSRARPLAGALIEDRFPLASEATGASGLAERYAAALFD